MFADLNSVEKPRMSKRTNQEVLKKMFMSFDKNSDGYITMDELTNGLKKDFSLRTIQEMFASYDKDQNKVLDFDEFLDMFTKDSPSLSPKKK
jgi:Ca2+-binding EF-hand superfamily protein